MTSNNIPPTPPPPSSPNNPKKKGLSKVFENAAAFVKGMAGVAAVPKNLLLLNKSLNILVNPSTGAFNPTRVVAINKALVQFLKAIKLTTNQMNMPKVPPPGGAAAPPVSGPAPTPTPEPDDDEAEPKKKKDLTLLKVLELRYAFTTLINDIKKFGQFSDDWDKVRRSALGFNIKLDDHAIMEAAKLYGDNTIELSNEMIELQKVNVPQTEVTRGLISRMRITDQSTEGLKKFLSETSRNLAMNAYEAEQLSVRMEEFAKRYQSSTEKMIDSFNKLSEAFAIPNLAGVPPEFLEMFSVLKAQYKGSEQLIDSVAEMLMNPPQVEDKKRSIYILIEPALREIIKSSGKGAEAMADKFKDLLLPIVKNYYDRTSGSDTVTRMGFLQGIAATRTASEISGDRDASLRRLAEIVTKIAPTKKTTIDQDVRKSQLVAANAFYEPQRQFGKSVNDFLSDLSYETAKTAGELKIFGEVLTTVTTSVAGVSEIMKAFGAAGGGGAGAGAGAGGGVAAAAAAGAAGGAAAAAATTAAAAAASKILPKIPLKGKLAIVGALAAALYAAHAMSRDTHNAPAAAPLQPTTQTPPNVQPVTPQTASNVKQNIEYTPSQNNELIRRTREELMQNGLYNDTMIQIGKEQAQSLRNLEQLVKDNKITDPTQSLREKRK